MQRDQAAFPVLLALTLSANSAMAEDAPPNSFGYEVSVPSVEVHPVVRHRGRYVTGLTRADFVVLDDGKPATIESFATTVAALNVAIVLDASDSMVPHLPRVTAAALQFLNHLAASDRASAFVFHRDLLHAVGPTIDRAAVEHALESSPTGGGTLLHDTLLEIVDRFVRPGERNVMVLFSDGQDSGSGATAADALASVVRAGVVVYTLAINSEDTTQAARHALTRLADTSGGEAHFLASVKKLDTVFGEILDDLRAQYRLSFTPHSGDPGERAISVNTLDRRYKVRCRQSYVAE